MSTVPTGYNTVMPYLIIDNANDFITFTEKVFHAALKNKHMRDENTIMHAEVAIDDSILMFAQSTDQYPAQPGSLFVYVANADDTYKKALDAGATTIMPLSDQSYGRTCGVKDPCSNIWWITSVK